jgi:hypothetical protein
VTDRNRATVLEKVETLKRNSVRKYKHSLPWVMGSYLIAVITLSQTAKDPALMKVVSAITVTLQVFNGLIIVWSLVVCVWLVKKLRDLSNSTGSVKDGDLVFIKKVSPLLNALHSNVTSNADDRADAVLHHHLIDLRVLSVRHVDLDCEQCRKVNCDS